MDNTEIKKINKNHIKDIALFIENCGNSKNFFTYFNKRDVSVIENHIATFLVYVGNIPIAYSHLDKEDDKVWLGICVSEMYTGKKIGKILLENTIEAARKEKLESIFLSVHKANEVAIHLYKKNGFVQYYENNLVLFMKKEL